MTGFAASPDHTGGGTPHSGGPNPSPLPAAVRGALERTGHTSLRRVEVSYSAGVIVLRGAVPSFYLKQLAQGTVMAVVGVVPVRNELEVGAPDANQS